MIAYATHPHGNFETFAHEMQRVIAAVLGLSAEQLSQDWSKTNYSSARRPARSVEDGGTAARRVLPELRLAVLWRLAVGSDGPGRTAVTGWRTAIH